MVVHARPRRTATTPGTATGGADGTGKRFGSQGGRARPARAPQGQFPRAPAAQFLRFRHRRRRPAELASAQGVRVLGASNYYPLRSVRALRGALDVPLEFFPCWARDRSASSTISGMRARRSRPREPRRCTSAARHHPVAPMNARAADLMGMVRSFDSDRIVAMITTHGILRPRREGLP